MLSAIPEGPAFRRSGYDVALNANRLPFELWTADCYVWGSMGQGFGARIRKLYTAVYEFVTEKGIETHEEGKASRAERTAHFWLLVFKSFSRNRCPLRATALAYTTLLALIPLLAVSLGLVSGFLQEKGPNATKELLGQIIDAAAPQLKALEEAMKVEAAKQKAAAEAGTNVEQPAPAKQAATSPGTPQKLMPREQAIERIDELVTNANAKTLGFTGFIGLIMVAILLLATIEGTFNDIWGVTRGRTWWRRVVQYWALVSLGPMAMFSIIYLAGTQYFRTGQHAVETLPFIGKALVLVGIYATKALPFVLVSVVFALLYKMMPNTQVNWRAAFIGGVVGGSLWLMLNIFSAVNLGRVIGMSKIYGTALGIIPIFLLGLYFSWLIMLFGAQVAYAFQNRDVYLQEKKAESVNQRNREYVALRVMTLLAQRFEYGQRPPTVLEVASELSVPSRLVGRVLQPLIDAGLALEVTADKNDVGYAPARPTETITCYDVLQTLRAGGGQELETRDEKSRAIVCAHFERIEQAERQAAANVTLRDLVHQVPAIAPADTEQRRMGWNPA
jgi:membrane protein